MAIDPRYIELIHADIDGEIDAAGKAELDAFLAENPEGRAAHEGMVALSRSLEEIPELDPPAHLKHVIMNMAPPAKAAAPAAPGFLERMLSTRALGYVGTFAAGVIFSLAVVSSNDISTGVFDDVTGLVGTMADSQFVAAEHDSFALNESAVAGAVVLRSKGSLLILDFDLVAHEPVEIDVRYADRTIWFNGFAQLESSGTSVAAESGEITLQLNGKQRFATFLNNPGKRATTIEIRFIAGGQVAREANLEFGG